MGEKSLCLSCQDASTKYKVTFLVILHVYSSERPNFQIDNVDQYACVSMRLDERNTMVFGVFLHLS